MAERLREQTGYEQGAFVRPRRASVTSPQYAGIPRRAMPPVVYEDEEEEEDAPHTRSSAIRYTQPRQEVYTRDNRRIVVHREPPPVPHRTHWMFFAGMAMAVMVVGWVALSAFGTWWQGKQDDWKYGIPRTFQVSQFVGHGDTPDHPNHFIAVNTGGMIEVVEMNVLTPKADHIYPITTAIDPTIPVALSFADMNHDGKIDMLVAIGNINPYVVILLNTGVQFTH